MAADEEGERGTMTITCPFCQHRIKCLQCDNGICEACGADLWAEDAIPFTAPLTPNELEFMERMLPIQREAITGTHTTDNETITLEEAREKWLKNPEAQRIYEESEPAYQAERIIQILKRGGE